MKARFSLASRFGLFLWAVLILGGAVLLADPGDQEDNKPDEPARPPLGLKIGELFGKSGGSLGGPLSSGKEVTFSAGFKVAENGRDGLLSVRAAIAEGWHVYSLTQPKGAPGPNASRISITKGEQLERVGTFSADAPPHVREVEGYSVPVEEHEREVTWAAPIVLAEGTDPQSLVIELRYDGQACTDGVNGEGGLCNLLSNVPVTARYAGLLEQPPPHLAAPPKAGPPGKEEETVFRDSGAMLTLSGALDKSVVAPGEKARLKITATPDPDWFVYALERRDPKLVSKPTLIAFTELSGLSASEPVPSEQPKVKQTGIPSAPEARYHPETISWTIELAVPADAAPGPREIVGLIGYQTCRDQNCLPPQAAEFRGQLTVGAPGEASEASLAFAAARYKTVAELAEEATSGFSLAQIKTPSGAADWPLHWVLPIALLGGFILNFMPCVLPVIGLKILSFVQQAGQSRARVFALNVWYTAGMLSVFMVLATLLVVWNLGWGEQNNNNIYNVAMVAVIFTMGLSFLGVWEIPIPGFVGSGAAGELAQKEGPLGAFFKGAITTLLATPCSGPGLATAIAWCSGKPPSLVYLVFAFLGLGMALPYLVIGLNPKLVRFLPRPGAWMETFKQTMGFVLLGTVVFIFTYMPAALIVPTVALLFGLWAACWWIGRTPQTAELPQTVRAWVLGSALAAGVGAFAFLWLSPYMADRFSAAVEREIAERQAPSEVAMAAAKPRGHKNPHELPWQPFSFARLSELTAERKTVLVDFTADWCLTCKTLEAAVLNTKDVRDAVEKHSVETLVADWTNKDPEISQLLEALGSKQIPVLAIFPAGKPNEPIVLIGGYTQGTLLKRIEEAAAIGQTAGAAATAMK